MGPCQKHGPFCLLIFPLQDEKRGFRRPIREKKSHNVLRQESEGEVTQGETEGFDRSDRVLLGEPEFKKGIFRVPFKFLIPVMGRIHF